MLTALATAASALVPLQWVSAEVTVQTRAEEVCGPATGMQIRRLPFPASHVALHWDGHPDATVRAALSADGKTFGDMADVERDEVGEQRRDGRTYGALLSAEGASVIALDSDRVVGRLCVLAMADGERKVERRVVPAGKVAGSAVMQPDIKARSHWGADESLRFTKQGAEIWPPEFHKAQKLLVHHTATKNRDRDPKATIRSMYRYHAVTQGWGDIGYNYLIDEAGVIYKGRHSHAPGSTNDTITGDYHDGTALKVVRAGHAYGFNVGTVGVALLGTLSRQAPTTNARTSLEKFLAWESSVRGLSAEGSSTYTNEVDPSYVKENMPNIAGHRDVNATDCPGGALYDQLPTIRKNVAAQVAAAGG